MRSLLFLIISISTTLYSNTFYPPLKGRLTLSASFGELRSGHFHSGIDIKTGGKINKPIYSIADGYISRIKIKPGGYGKALYITSPDKNIIAVYGHLNSFSKAINKYIKAYQYKNQTFKLDIRFPKNKFPVKKGNFIAYSGNSGMSFGPHLHFEVRNLNNKALNPLRLNYNIKDNVHPTINSVYYYPRSKSTSIENKNLKKIVKVKISSNHSAPTTIYKSRIDTLRITGWCSFGISGFDRLNYSWNKCGYSSVKIKINNETIYSYNINLIDFETTRYINAHIDFEELIKNSKKVHTSFIKPNNKLNLYQDLKNSGSYFFEIGKIYKIKFIVSDYNKNKSTTEQIIKGSSKYIPQKVNTLNIGNKILYNRFSTIKNKKIKVEFEKDCLYENEIIYISRRSSNSKVLKGYIFRIGEESIPVQKRYKITIPYTIDTAYKSKVVIVKCNNKKQIVNSYTTKYEDSCFIANPRSFGNFSLAIDKYPPKIKPLFSRRKIGKRKSISFKITDYISGIKSINGYIDGKWVLFEYSSKTKIAKHYFDRSIIRFNKKHFLELYVKDKVNNEKIYKLNFFK